MAKAERSHLRWAWARVLCVTFNCKLVLKMAKEKTMEVVNCSV